jgi:hypothetical protein
MESVKNSIKEEESDPSTEFVTLYELLERNVPHSKIATEIETVGISGWDRYGRFHELSKLAKTNAKVDPSCEVAFDALDHLAKDYAWVRKVRYPNERKPRDIHYGEDTRLLSFGWIAEKLPIFEELREDGFFDVEYPMYSRKERTNHLYIIAYLVNILIHRVPQKPRKLSFATQDDLLTYIEIDELRTSGLSRSNLQKVFKRANNA